MNRYKFMTCSLVVCNVVSLVAMFIAAFWGFTYPSIKVDDYVSGKSAIVATFMCILSCICLCGLNYQNYYMLIIYGCVHVLIMFNQLFSILPFEWTRIPNYPIIGDSWTQIYILLAPKTILVCFAFCLAWKLRQDDIQRKLSRSDPRCRCDSSRTLHTASFHSAPQSDHQTGHISAACVGHTGHSAHSGHSGHRNHSGHSGHIGHTLSGALPPPLPPPNAIIRTPPLYPLHRPSLPNPPPMSPISRTPIHVPFNGPLSGPPLTPPWRNERKWSSTGREYSHYYRDLYNPNY